MKQTKKEIAEKMFIGYLFELFCFILGGALLGKGKIIIGFVLLILGFFLSIWTGSRIEEWAIIKFQEKK